MPPSKGCHAIRRAIALAAVSRGLCAYEPYHMNGASLPHCRVKLVDNTVRYITDHQAQGIPSEDAADSPLVREAMANPGELYTIPFSHYCELARWSLHIAKMLQRN